jgi:H+/Cl- antiporter ClcA
VWLLVLATGVAAGFFGALMIGILRLVARFAFGYHAGGFEGELSSASPWRRVMVLAVVGVVCGYAWYRVRRAMAHQSSDLDDQLWTGTANVAFPRSFVTSVFSEIAVGAGASLGREAAPKLLAAASASALARWRGLSIEQRRLLVACGGGAGMAAVYNVPLGGALITAELLYGSLSLPVILPALTCSWIATTVASFYVGFHPVYAVPSYSAHVSHLVFALVVGPLIGLASVAWVRVIGWVSYHQLRGRWVLVGVPAAFTAVGLLALKYPQVLGNGQGIAQSAFGNSGTAGAFGLLLMLAVLKPLATALCLGGGATGGLFTPTLSLGAILGAVCGMVWNHLFTEVPVGGYAVIGAAALIGAAMQTPLAALALIIELTHSAGSLIVPLVAATALATTVGRYVDGYSIYSSRLPAQSPLSS